MAHHGAVVTLSAGHAPSCSTDSTNVKIPLAVPLNAFGDSALVKTTTAQQHGHVCPLCGESLAQDDQGNGFVRHLARPRGATIFDDADAIEEMLAAGDLETDFRDYFERTGRCPYQQGQRD